MGHTTKTAFSGTTDWEAGLTEVFNGSISVVANEVTVTFATPFAYNGTDNLIVAIDENGASYDDNSDEFFCSSVSGDRSLYYRNDNTNPDPTGTLPTASGTRQAIPNIQFIGITQSCPAPSVLAANNITATSADLTWTDNAGAANWVIEYDVAGFTQGSGTTVTTNTNPHSLSSLTAATTYEYYVRSVCTPGVDSSSWVGPFSFETPCLAITAPWTESFATATLPVCWTQGGDNAWEFGSAATTPTGFADYGAENVTDHTYGATGTFIGMDGSDNGNGDVSTLTTPMIDISGLTTPQLSYWVFYNNTDDGALNELLVEFFDGAAWTTVETIQTNLGANWLEYTTDLSTFTVTGNVQVRFTVTGNSAGGSTFYNDILIDDVTIGDVPACPAPTALTISNITGTTVDFGWTANGPATSWNIEYGPSGFTPTGTPTTTGVSNPTTVSSLTPITGYDFYVQADCGGTTSLWVGPISATTTCPVYTPDYNENFNSYVPNCWEEAQGLLTSSATLTGTTSAWVVDGFANNGTTGAARMNIYSTTQDEWLISPSIDLTGGPFQLEYDIALTDYATTQSTTMDADDTLAVVISTDDGATWSTANILHTYTAGSEPLATGERAYIDLSAYSGVVKFGFYARSSASGVDNDIFIDSFKVTNLCLPVNSVDTQVACDSYTWIDGNTYTASNNSAIHTIVGGAASGCDSIITLNLTINNSATATDVQTACGSFTWIDGITYTASNNTAIDTIQTVAGCDSIVTLDLTIIPLATGTDVQSACDSYTWIDGNTYTASTNTATYAIAGGAANGCDSIVTLDLTITYSAMYTDVHTACDTFTWIDGVTYSASNNTATYTFPGAAANGCDSIVTLDLTINAPDVSITTSGVTLTVGEAGATYAWLDCDNNNAPIAGETGQSFTATANGNYAVEVTKNGCADTSACTAITTVSVDDITSLENIVIYPNPVKNTVNVDLGNVNNASVSLLDMNGKELFIEEQVEDTVYSFEMNQAPGVYFIRVRSNESVKLFKVIKE